MLSRGGLFALLWWILADGAESSWWIGVPAVMVAVAASTLLLPPQPFRWHELLRFAPLFLMRSLLGGIDVARRAYHPEVPIDPDIIAYPLTLPPGLPRVFMANTISLLPGTLSAGLDGDVLQVHVLGGRKGLLAEIESVEKSVARLFAASRTTV
jgi:multicomponent Na+:H+ antiporter subunit E